MFLLQWIKVLQVREVVVGEGIVHKRDYEFFLSLGNIEGNFVTILQIFRFYVSNC